MLSLVEERFWSKVDKSGPVPDHRDDLGPCWMWTASKFRDGYGQFWLEGRNRAAHQIAYELASRIMPKGLTIDHLCRNRACVNPDHLEPVTNRTNILRGNGLAAANAQKTHCPQGHVYDSLRKPSGYRECKTCNRLRMRRLRKRQSSS